MKRIILLLSCLVLASVVKALDTTDEEDPTDETPIDGEGDETNPDTLQYDTKKYEDELMEETVNQDPPEGTETEGDEETADDQDDDKFLLNGQKVGPEEMDSAEDPPVVIDGEEQGDEPAEDPAPYGWIKHPFSWCTVQGRALISKGVGKKIDFRECQRRCIARKGCMAIEFWEAYNYACFVCTNTKLIRPYTNKKDLAYPAHVWVQIKVPPSPTRPTPTRPTRPTGTRPTIPSHPAVNVTCGKNEMWIKIPKYLLPALDREHLRLSDVNCGATETRTHYILHTKLTECHTVIRHTKNFVCYMNKVEEIPVQPHQIITRVREVEIPFSCYYNNMGVVSAVGLQVKSKKIVFSKKGYGKFVLEMKIFRSASFQYEYKKKDFPVMLPLRKILYVEVSVDTEDRRLEILAEECFATPDSDPNKPGLKYTFIRDGCAVDDTVNFIPTPDKRKQRFSLEAFAFIGDHQFVYMHCRVKICNASDPNSRCAQGCVRRGKRSLMTQETKDEEYNLAQGPFMRSEEDETQLEETMQKARNEEKSAKFPTLVAAMAVVAAVCVMGVSYFAWDRRKQKPLRDYQRLTVPSED